MSSDRLENSIRPAADRFLVLLKMRGPQTAADLGKATGVTGEAARQQLVRLAAEGLIVSTAEPRGVGRPAQVWGLTEAGNARFPDSHAELTAQLIRSIRTQFGEAVLDRLIDSRSADSKATYAAALEGASDLGERVSRLARGASAGRVHGRIVGGGRRVRSGREPLSDLRGGLGLPGVLPGRTGDIQRSVGARRYRGADRTHHRRRPALRLPHHARKQNSAQP